MNPRSPATSFFFFLLLLFPLSLPFPTLAYNISEVDGDGIHGDADILLGWNPVVNPFPLRIAFVAAEGKPGSDDFGDRAEVLDAVRSGFQVWTEVATSNAAFDMSFTDAAVTAGVLELTTDTINDPANYSPFNTSSSLAKPQPPTGDGPYNVVVFIEDGWARSAQPTDSSGVPLSSGDPGYFDGPYGFGFPTNAVAITMWSYSPTTRYITGVDMFMNGEFFDTTNEGLAEPYQVWSTVSSSWVDQSSTVNAGWAATGEPGRWDVFNVVAHEVGHVLGLAHPSLDRSDRISSTMWYSASDGDTNKRSLEEDDMNGVTFLYPNPADLPVVPPDESTMGLPYRILVDGGTTGDDTVTTPSSTGGGCAMTGEGVDLAMLALLLLPLLFLLRRPLQREAVRKDPPMAARSRRSTLTFLVGALLLSALPARASVMIPMDLDALVTGASDIVVGQVVEQSCHWARNRSSIYTLTKIWVREATKGQLGDQVVTVRTLGGQIGEQGVGASLMTVFRPGEELLLFLNGSGPGQYRVHGSVQGKYQLLRDAATGKAFVRKDMRAVHFLRGTAAAQGALVAGGVEHEALDDFLGRIRARMNGSPSR